jgi:hypothetical protein
MKRFVKKKVKKEVKEVRKISPKQYLEPLLALPYVFLGIYIYENGFNVLSAVLGLLLLVIVPAVLVAFREQL